MKNIDTFLDAIAAALIAGMAEFTAANVRVWDGGQAPDDDIAAGCGKCHGVSALIYDLGGDCDPDDDDNPVILAEAAVELYIDPTKRPKKHTEMRIPGTLRDAAMTCLHLNPLLSPGEHSFYEAKIRGYKPVADPTYIVYRIRIRRVIELS